MSMVVKCHIPVCNPHVKNSCQNQVSSKMLLVHVLVLILADITLFAKL